jgi:hypothetical protein
MDKKEPSDESSKLTDEYLQRASYLGTILPLLDIFYEAIIERGIKKYNLNVVKEFWIFLGLFVITVLYYLFGTPFGAVIFFAFAMIFSLVIYNLDFFKKRLLPDNASNINQFISEIGQHSLPEVREFIRQYSNQLTETDIKSIFNSKHGNNWIIYDYINKYQKYPDDILVYLIQTDRIKIIGESLFIKYLKRFRMGISYDNYQVIVTHFREKKKIVKIANLFNPLYLKSGGAFQRAASFVQSFYLSTRRGRISFGIFMISFFIVIIASITSYRQISTPYAAIEPYSSFPLLFLLNYGFVIIFATGILSFLITLVFIAIAGALWFILGCFAPNQPQT